LKGAFAKLIKNVLELVEIRTKLASVLPMFTGVFYAMILGYPPKPLNFMLLAISLLLIDMVTTGLNNYFDAKKAVLMEGYHFDHHNPITSGKMSSDFSLRLLFLLSFIAILSGIGLVYVSHWLILVLGTISFAVGIGYSAGPLPISRTPFGELFSGTFMGILIPMIAGFSMIPIDAIVKTNFRAPFLTVSLNLQLVLQFIAVGLPLGLLIANIMLANNLCDIDEDIVNRRYTLPVVIGKTKALKLFNRLFFTAYGLLLLLILTKLLSIISIFVAATLYWTLPMLKRFVQSPSKQTTFVNAVKIFFLFAAAYVLSLFLTAFLPV
jgi:1,4-dihydroxy-2-naphthoate octaprenyltransferase